MLCIILACCSFNSSIKYITWKLITLLTQPFLKLKWLRQLRVTWIFGSGHFLWGQNLIFKEFENPFPVWQWIFIVAKTFDRHATNLRCLELGFIVRHVCVRHTFGDFAPNRYTAQLLLNVSLYLYTIDCFVCRNIFGIWTPWSLSLTLSVWQTVYLPNLWRGDSVGVEIAAHNAGIGRWPSVQSAAPLAAM